MVVDETEAGNFVAVFENVAEAANYFPFFIGCAKLPLLATFFNLWTPRARTRSALRHFSTSHISFATKQNCSPQSWQQTNENLNRTWR